MNLRACYVGLAGLLCSALPAIAAMPETAPAPSVVSEPAVGESSVVEPGVSLLAHEEGQTAELCWLGQDFVCFRQQEQEGLRSEEYRLRTEEGTDWTQRVAVRQFRLGPQVSLAGFCGVFLKAVASACPGSQVECLLKPGRRAVYAVADGEKDPLLRTNVCLLLLEAGSGEVLLFQYSQRPGRLDQNLAELQLNAWRERFLAQARHQAEAVEAAPAHE